MLVKVARLGPKLEHDLPESAIFGRTRAGLLFSDILRASPVFRGSVRCAKTPFLVPTLLVHPCRLRAASRLAKRLNIWRYDWSEQKKVWCCENVGQGCSYVAP